MASQSVWHLLPKHRLQAVSSCSLQHQFFRRLGTSNFSKQRLSVALYLLLLLLCWPGHQCHAATGSEILVEQCKGKKIAVLDLNDLAKSGNYPSCDLNKEVHIDPGNGIVYSTRTELEKSLPHMFGTHAAPWFLYEAIKSSKYFITDIEDADIVFVYDYCYYIWWLADVHSFGRERDRGPGDHLLQAYKTMMQLPAWKRTNGATFAFYDAHPGFMAGEAAGPVQDMKCWTFRNAIHLIVDTPMRNVCQEFWSIMKILVTPYVPSLLDINEPEAYLARPFIPADKRPILAYNRANCDPWDDYGGKRMRYWFSHLEWGNSKQMDVRCTNEELNAEGHLPFNDMYKKMQASKFCIAFPGDAASTRRLSEIFLAGCIPVFIGPPYHSMPFHETVPYAQLGMFFIVKNHTMWLKEPGMHWELHPTIRSEHETEAQWWVPDADIPKSDFIEVDQPNDVVAHMENMPAAELDRKLRLTHEYGSRFSFMQKLTQPPNAVNSLFSGMCLKQDESPPGHFIVV